MPDKGRMRRRAVPPFFYARVLPGLCVMCAQRIAPARAGVPSRPGKGSGVLPQEARGAVPRRGVWYAARA